MVALADVLSIEDKASETRKTGTYLSIAWVKAVVIDAVVQTDVHEVKDFSEG